MSKAHDIDIMTKTLWMEARGEPDIGIQAVACVIYNRFKSKKWYSKILGVASLANVCLKEWQFSCWNKGDQCDTKLPKANKESRSWKICEAFAIMTANGWLPDIIDGADHYYAKTMKNPPAWAKKMKFKCQIGHHKFYKDETI